MKKYLQLVVAIFVVMAFCSPVVLQAGVLDRIYVEGGVVMPMSNNIDNSFTNAQLQSLNATGAGMVDHTGEVGGSGTVGGEVYAGKKYITSLEAEYLKVGFSWDGKPLALYRKSTGESVGNIFLSQTKDVQFISLNFKSQWQLGFFRPFVKVGWGWMTVKSSDRSFAPNLNFDLKETITDTAMAGKIGAGFGILIFPSKIGDRVELDFGGFYVKGLGGNQVAAMEFTYGSAALKIKLG